jgi:hypothetical protein
LGEPNDNALGRFERHNDGERDGRSSTRGNRVRS